MIVMAVFAHPDDESICAGTLARLAAEGHEVRLVCATRGEQGEIIDPSIDAAIYPKGPARGLFRERELAAACLALGIHAPVFMDHEDSGFPVSVGANNERALMNQDMRELELAVLQLMLEYRPEVMITFDPHGMYGHIDHLIIHQAASRAFWAAGGVVDTPPIRLYYPVRTIEQVREAKLRRPGSATERLVPEVDGVSDSSVAVVCDIRAFAGQKVAAIRAHSSQFGTPELVDEMLQRQTGSLEVERFALGGVRGLAVSGSMVRGSVVSGPL